MSRLARFFDVKISHFFEGEEELCSYEVVRTNERRVVKRVISKAGKKHGYTYESLSFYKRNKKMEPFIVRISERSDDETMYNHEGEEFLLVLSGIAEVLLDEERIKLEVGDAIYFDSSVRHRVLSYDGNEAQVLAIVTR